MLKLAIMMQDPEGMTGENLPRSYPIAEERTRITNNRIDLSSGQHLSYTLATGASKASNDAGKTSTVVHVSDVGWAYQCCVQHP